MMLIPITHYPLASIEAFLKNAPAYGNAFDVATHIVNVNQDVQDINQLAFDIAQKYSIANINFIAIGCYIWAEKFIHPFMKAIRQHGFHGIFILGGYQISECQSLENALERYPLGQIFIQGFGEESLLQVLKSGLPQNVPNIMSNVPDFSTLSSLYLNGILEIPQNTPMVRWETKRGCPFQCGFCRKNDETIE